MEDFGATLWIHGIFVLLIIMVSFRIYIHNELSNVMGGYWLLSVRFRYKPGYKSFDLLNSILSLVEIRAFRLKSKSCKGNEST